jgi:hypothetical protein
MRLLYNYLNPSILPPLVGNDKPGGRGGKKVGSAHPTMHRLESLCHQGQGGGPDPPSRAVNINLMGG